MILHKVWNIMIVCIKHRNEVKMNVQKTKIGSSKTNFATEIVTEVGIGCLTQGQEINVKNEQKVTE